MANWFASAAKLTSGGRLQKSADWPLPDWKVRRHRQKRCAPRSKTQRSAMRESTVSSHCERCGTHLPNAFERDPVRADARLHRDACARANDVVLEPKFDGWRVIVEVDDGVRVWTRRGHELTERLPELAPLADALDRRVVLDGELVAGAGRASDFYGVLGRVGARARRSPLT